MCDPGAITVLHPKLFYRIVGMDTVKEERTIYFVLNSLEKDQDKHKCMYVVVFLGKVQVLTVELFEASDEVISFSDFHLS